MKKKNLRPVRIVGRGKGSGGEKSRVKIVEIDYTTKIPTL